MLLLFFSIILGGTLRLGSVLASIFPLNDGGLFFTMTQDLIANGFHLPAYTSYNNLQIPFTYPPLGFYLTGLITFVTGWNLLDVMRVLPALFSTLAIPAFYLLAREISENDYQLGTSVLIFSLLPPTIEWLIMGGGITRSPAFFFSLLSIWSFLRLFNLKKPVDLILAISFSSITLLLHPEAIIHTAAAGIVIFIYRGWNKSGVKKALLVAVFILLISSPWWLSVIYTHGLSPFQAAASTGSYEWDNYIGLLFFSFTGETGIRSIAVLALLGFFIELAKRRSILPLWLLLTFVIGPRSASLYLSPVIALLASTTISKISVLIDTVSPIIQDTPPSKTILSSKLSGVLLTILILYWIFSTITTITNVSGKYSLKSEDISTMSWVKTNTEMDSRFLILTGQPIFQDPISEWFPAQSNRQSLATVQGREWLIEENFYDVMDRSNELRACVYQDLNCVQNWLEKNKMTPDYLLLKKVIHSNLADVPIIFTQLSEQLNQSEDFSLVYDSKTINIYKLLK